MNFVPYEENDIDEIIKIINATGKASVILGAFTLYSQKSTQALYGQAQRLLKELLYKELVEATSGAIRPKLSRLARLIFLEKNGAVYLDGTGLPVFRPGKEDDSVPSLHFQVSESLLKAAKEEARAAAADDDTSLSSQLLTEVIGYGSEKEVEALKSIKLLSEKINQRFRRQRQVIVDKFQESVTGTELSELMKKKEDNEKMSKELKKDLQDTQKAAEDVTTEIDELENIFQDLLSSVKLEDELFDLNSLMEGNDSFNVILQSFIDRYELLAGNEKAANQSITDLDNYKAQRLRLEGILNHNIQLTNETKEAIENLKEQKKQNKNDIETAERKTTEAETEKKTKEDIIQKAKALETKIINVVTDLRNVKIHEDSVKNEELKRIEQFLTDQPLRDKCMQLKNAKEHLSKVEEKLEEKEKNLRELRGKLVELEANLKLEEDETKKLRSEMDKAESEYKDGKITEQPRLGATKAYTEYAYLLQKKMRIR